MQLRQNCGTNYVILAIVYIGIFVKKVPKMAFF